jgi:hypothetical protein
MKTQKGHFIPLPDNFSVTVPNSTLPDDERFLMKPSGLYITHNSSNAWIHYAGEKAVDSQAVFEIPSDPSFLRTLSKELVKLAKKIETE